ncbi:A-kinase-interacting protein 1 [Pelodytes ibericus]
MENQYKWVEYSLRQTAELGREVLQRAKRREVNWSLSCKHGQQMRRRQQVLEEAKFVEENEADLEDAFSTMANFMCRATQQCEKYHLCKPVDHMSKQETRHMCRSHCPKSTQRELNPGSGQNLAADHVPLISRRRTPQDVHIEVAPGTYCISGGSRDSTRQTHMVNIPPGQSVDLTFHI